jgi:hypothetical protein
LALGTKESPYLIWSLDTVKMKRFSSCFNPNPSGHMAYPESPDLIV